MIWFLASKEGHKEIANILIESNVELNAQDKDGLTALHIGYLSLNFSNFIHRFLSFVTVYIAESNGKIELVELLKKSGANLFIKNNKRQTPIEMSINETINAFFLPRLLSKY